MKNSHRRLFCAVLGFCATGSFSFAQDSQAAAPTVPTATEAVSTETTAPALVSPSTTDVSTERLQATDSGKKTDNVPADPNDRKADLKALLGHVVKDGQPYAEIQKKVDDYLADKSMPAKDRFDIRFATYQLELSRKQNLTKDAVMELRADHARKLAAEFPDDTRGHAYFLQLATIQAGARGRQMAEELLKSSAPETAKQAATRLIAQCDAVGKPVNVEGVDLTLYRGKPLIIYTWSLNRLPNLDTVKVWAKMFNVGLIAINVDTDSEAAKKQADSLAVPGTRLYEPKGVDGPLASALHFTSRTSVYLVDSSGVLVDVQGHENMSKKLKALTAAKEVKP